MGDVISSHLDEAKREIITARTGETMGKFGHLYEQQYAVALFNKVRFDVEGGAGPQPQLLHRKVPLENKSIFSGSLFQYLEENKKWRNRFIFVPDSYNINFYNNKASHDRRLNPKGTINCAGYKVLTSMEEYLDLISNCLPDVKAKVGSAPFLKCATQFPLVLWHPYARHYYFCVVTEKEQHKWHAVLQDCVRHTNDGLSEENKVQTPAFTDAVRLYRQAQGNYGTWEMMCGVPAQILSNLVMEGLLPELRELISPRLKGKLHDRQRTWILISDAVYSLVQGECQAHYSAVLQKCVSGGSSLEASIRTDMDQIITSKEHVTNKIRAVVLPKAEKLLKVSIQPYISSILDALMEPTSRGFSEVRDVFFREMVDMSKNSLNEGTKETVAQHMEKISMLAFHPVKMQSCYEKVEPLSLEGLQQRFDVSSPSVFVQRAQILMREQMDDAVYTFEQILHQSLESQGTEELCKTIQRCQDRVIKKFDYDSSTVRKRFFREALLQIFIPYMLKQLSPTCAPELPRFQELIFEDFSHFILVENIFEEVVLHSVMKDIMMAVKEAAVQRRHNLYRDSIVLGNSDPSLHLLGENPSIDWAGEYGGAPEEEEEEEAGEENQDQAQAQGEGVEHQKRRRMKQVVSMIQVDGSPVLPNESCLSGIQDIPEEDGEEEEEDKDVKMESSDSKTSPEQNGSASPKASEKPPDLSNGSVLKEEEARPEAPQEKEVPLKVETHKGVPHIEEKVKEEDSQPMVQEVTEEALPPPPSEEVPSGDTGATQPPALDVEEKVKEEDSQPTLVQEVSEEALPAPPSVEVPSGDTTQPTASDVEEKVKEEDSQPMVQEVSEEALPPPPLSQSEEVPSGDPETAQQSSADIEEKGSLHTDDDSQPMVQKVTEEALPPPPSEDVPSGDTGATQPTASDVEEKVKEEDSQPTVVQEVSEEALPPPPLPVVPCGDPESAPESPPEVTPDFPEPPHDDSGFQSPASLGEELEVVPQPTEEHSEVSQVNIDPAETKASDSEAPHMG